MHSQEATLASRFNRFTLSGGYADLDKETDYGRLENEQQLRLNGTAVLYGPWSLFGGAHYDLERNTMIRDYIGVGFDCDCFNAKFYYTEDYDTVGAQVDKDRSLLFSF